MCTCPCCSSTWLLLFGHHHRSPLALPALCLNTDAWSMRQMLDQLSRTFRAPFGLLEETHIHIFHNLLVEFESVGGSALLLDNLALRQVLQSWDKRRCFSKKWLTVPFVECLLHVTIACEVPVARHQS